MNFKMKRSNGCIVLYTAPKITIDMKPSSTAFIQYNLKNKTKKHSLEFNMKLNVGEIRILLYYSVGHLLSVVCIKSIARCFQNINQHPLIEWMSLELHASITCERNPDLNKGDRRRTELHWHKRLTVRRV